MMTAITINLLAEEQQAKQQRDHDPLKAVIACALGVAALVVGVGGVFLFLASQERTQLVSRQARWEQLGGGGAHESEFQKVKTAADEIIALNRARFLCAPQLALLKDLIPTNIQLSQFDFATVVEIPRGEAADEGEGDGKKAARPKRIERIVLRLNGRATSNRPELEVDRFLQTLRTDPQFSALVERIQLQSIARSAVDAGAGVPAVQVADFVIECRYREQP